MLRSLIPAAEGGGGGQAAGVQESTALLTRGYSGAGALESSVGARAWVDSSRQRAPSEQLKGGWTVHWGRVAMGRL